MWTIQHEILLKKWGLQAQYLHIMYRKAASVVHRKSQLLDLPMVVLCAITTSSIFMQMDQCSQTSQIVIGIFSLLTTVVTALTKFSDFPQQTTIFNSASHSYGNLVLDIQEQLSRPRGDRQSVHDFVNQVKISMRTLTTLPPVPTAILRQYLSDIDSHFKILGIPVHTDTVPVLSHQPFSGIVDDVEIDELELEELDTNVFNEKDSSVHINNAILQRYDTYQNFINPGH
jgi:hypothetical protein